jgi:hypothetical protein
VYGEHVFPLQAAILLSEPQEDFTGGEFVLTEQRPRMQSRVEFVPLERGDGVVWAVRGRRADPPRQRGVAAGALSRRDTASIGFRGGDCG